MTIPGFVAMTLAERAEAKARQYEQSGDAARAAACAQGDPGQVSGLLLLPGGRGPQVHGYQLPAVAIPHGNQSMASAPQ